MVAIRYQAPGEVVFIWREAVGETLREAAVHLIQRERRDLGGTVESVHWVSAKLVIPDRPEFCADDANGPQVRSTARAADRTRRAAQIVCVSTGSDDARLLLPPGAPRQVVLDVTVPAETTPGVISLLPD